MRRPRPCSCPHCGTANRVPRSPRARRAAATAISRCPGSSTQHDDDFAEVAERATLPVLVDLWAPWCGPCRMVSPALARLARDRRPIKLVKVDVDDHPALAAVRGPGGADAAGAPTARSSRGKPGPRRPSPAPVAGRRPAPVSIRPRAMSTVVDPHLSLVRPVRPRTPQGCEECLQIGSPWLHLRLCLTCGHVGLLRLLPDAARPRARRRASATRSCNPSSPARRGGGATSTRPTSEGGSPTIPSRLPPETPDLYGAYPG